MIHTNLDKNKRQHDDWIAIYRSQEFEAFDCAAFNYCATQMPHVVGSHVLDAGCGTAHKSQKLVKRGYRVTGVDFSEYAIETGLQQLPAEFQDKIVLEWGDLTSLHYDSNSFDHVLCWGVLMHIPEQKKAVQELIRVLRPGGSLVISEMNCWAPENVVDRWLRQYFRLGSSKISRSEMGYELWTSRSDGKLLTRTLDPLEFTKWISSFNMKLRSRRTCQLTQQYGRFHWATIRALIHHINRVCLEWNFPPQYASTNILTYTKE